MTSHSCIFQKCPTLHGDWLTLTFVLQSLCIAVSLPTAKRKTPAVVEELADATVVQEVEERVIQPASPLQGFKEPEKAVEPGKRKDKDDEDAVLAGPMRSLEQSRVLVARGRPPMKKASPKKTAAARGDDDDVQEKAMRQAEEELLEQKRRQQQLWEESLGRCSEGHHCACDRY